MNNAGKILTALTAGAVLGIVTGVLIAPEKGSETRKKIKEQGKKIADNVKVEFSKGKEKMKDIKEAMTDVLTNSAEKFS